VVVEELLRPLDVLLLEEARVGAFEERRADLFAEHVADLVAQDREERTPDEQHRKVQAGAVAGAQQPGREEQRVARQEEPDEQARLGEHDEQQAPDAVRVEQVVGVQPARPEGESRHGSGLLRVKAVRRRAAVQSYQRNVSAPGSTGVSGMHCAGAGTKL
jgi:hypothetical protein